MMPTPSQPPPCALRKGEEFYCFGGVANGQVKAMGKVRSDGGAVLGGGDYTVTKLGTGQWLLKIGSLTNEDGTLLITPEGGIPAAGANPVPNNTNNFLSYEWSSEQEGYIVNSRDNGTTTLQDGATVDEPMFSFVFLTPGQGLSYENPPLPSLAARDRVWADTEAGSESRPHLDG